MSRPDFNLDKKHTYTLDGVVYPSVTQIIKATVPKDLAWWGMTVGLEAILVLFDRGYGYQIREAADTKELVSLLTEKKLTTNHKMKEGGDRGKALHKCLEAWGREQKVIELADFQSAERPYVVALSKWLVDFEPDIHEMETITGSLEYGYAGTWDMKCTPRKGPHKGKYLLVDLKTTKRIYEDQHFPQVEAYEQAEVECGESPTDSRAVLQVGADQEYDFKLSTDDFGDFEVLLYHFKSIQARKERLKNGVAQKV